MSKETANNFFDALKILNSEFKGLGLSSCVLEIGTNDMNETMRVLNLSHIQDAMSEKGSGTMEGMPNWDDAGGQKIPSPDDVIMSTANGYDLQEQENITTLAKLGGYETQDGATYVWNYNSNSLVLSDAHFVKGNDISDGHDGAASNQTTRFVLKVFGKNGSKHSLIGDNVLKSNYGTITEAQVTIDWIQLFGPDEGSGTNYIVDFYNAENTLIYSFNRTTLPGKGESSLNRTNNLLENLSDDESRPVFDINGGSIIITINRSYNALMNFYDKCWNVGFGYHINKKIK